LKIEGKHKPEVGESVGKEVKKVRRAEDQKIRR